MSRRADGAFAFEVVHRDQLSGARTGTLSTPHGVIETPAFAPVGTMGAVKAVTPRDLAELGAQMIMVNAFHLAMRPGAEVVAALGGIEGLSGWDGPTMADSGGYQAFSLGRMARGDPDGVTFKYPADGSTHRFTPEDVIAVQSSIGADLIMPLDICTPHPATREQALADMELTCRWARRAIESHRREDQLLYGIVQGSVYPELRARGAERIAELGFRAFAIGGVSVGESKEKLRAAVGDSIAALPAGATRHLLGVGHPDDIVACVAAGVDTFDCVMPTRIARNGAALTMAGRLNLRNATYSGAIEPISDECGCYACRHYSRAAIRHFVNTDEILGLHLLTLHNLYFTLDLMRRIRAALASGTFSSFAEGFMASYKQDRPAAHAAGAAD